MQQPNNVSEKPTLRLVDHGTMPICIECRHPVEALWTQYSSAGDQSSGHNIRLTVCKNCGRFCDKYVEHDFVVLFIDLVLIKPQVIETPGAAPSSRAPLRVDELCRGHHADHRRAVACAWGD